jgi:hypothetical protein
MKHLPWPVLKIKKLSDNTYLFGYVRQTELCRGICAVVELWAEIVGYVYSSVFLAMLAEAVAGRLG